VNDRRGYALLALGLAVLAIFMVVQRDVGLWQLLVFAVLPDVALFVGIGENLKRGQRHPRAVPLYNALHGFALPGLLGVSAFWTGSAWLVAALAWSTHIAIDRSLGYGRRDRAGFQRRPRDELATPSSRFVVRRGRG